MNVEQQQHIMDGIFNPQERRGPDASYLTQSSTNCGSPNISSSSEISTSASGARSRRARDLRRTYAGISPSASLSPRNPAASLAPPQPDDTNVRENLTHPAGSANTMVVDPIYQDIEMRSASAFLEQQQHQKQRIEVHVPGSLRRARQHRRQRRENVEESFRLGAKGLAEESVSATASALKSKSSSHSDASSAGSDGQKHRRCVTDLLLNQSSGSGSCTGNLLHKADALRQQPQQMTNHLNTTTTTASTTSTSNARDHMARVELSASTENNELSELRTSSFVYTGPFDSEAAVLMNYTTTAQQQRLQKQQGGAEVEPIIFRDDIASLSGSLMTGISQQELLRKKARAAGRRSSNKQSRRPKPLVQLPATLLLGSPSHRSPTRGYANADKQVTTPSRLSRWNIVKHLSRSRSDELESSTAETTQDDPSLLNGTSAAAAAAPPGSFAAAVAPTDRMVRSIRAPYNQQHQPESSERSDSTSFPLLSTSVNNSSISMNNDSGVSEGNEALVAASAWIMNREMPPPENSSSSIAAKKSNDSASQLSSTSSEQRRGVRFAEKLEEDDESQPWDQRNDSAMAKKDKSSPTSVLDNLRLGNHHENRAYQKPKSILRPSRFMMDNPVYYGTGRRALDFESLRMIDRVASMSQDLEVDGRQLPTPSYELESEERVMVDYELAKRAATRNSINQHLDVAGTSLKGIKLDMSSDTDVPSRTMELQPPREGFLDTSGSEISSIHAGRPVPNGKSDEKHLHESIASARQMNNGDIAARIIVEDYPDPPTILNMDDDETVLSAHVFIETVAAIVIQAATRRFLAIRRAAKMKKAKHLLLTKLVDINTSSVTKSMSMEEEYFRFADVSVQTEDGFAFGMYDLAAVQIQSAFRGFWVRDCLDVDHYCATAIQTAYRTRSCRLKYTHVLSQIITVQSWWRRNIARDLAADTLAYVIFIQAVFRGFRVRRRFKAYCAKKMRVKQMAATVIQANWRSFVGESHFIRLLVDVLIVQTIVRRWLAGRKAASLRQKLQTKAALRPSSQQQTSAKRIIENSRAVTRERDLSKPQRMQQTQQKFDIQRQNTEMLPKRTVATMFRDDELQQSPTDETDCCANDRRRRNPDPPGIMRMPVVGTLDQSAMTSDEPDPLSTSQILADIGAEESALIEAGKFWNVTLTSSKSTDSSERKSNLESTTRDLCNKTLTKDSKQKPCTNLATLAPSKSYDSENGDDTSKPSTIRSNMPVGNEKGVHTTPEESTSEILTPCKSTDSSENQIETSSNILEPRNRCDVHIATRTESMDEACTASVTAEPADNRDRLNHSFTSDCLLASSANENKLGLDASSRGCLKSADCNEKSNVTSGQSAIGQDRTMPIVEEDAQEVGITNAGNPWNVTLSPVKHRDTTYRQCKPVNALNGDVDFGNQKTLPGAKGEDCVRATNSVVQSRAIRSTFVSTDPAKLVKSESTAKSSGDHRHMFVAKGKKHILATRTETGIASHLSSMATSEVETTTAEVGTNNSPFRDDFEKDPIRLAKGNTPYDPARTTEGAAKGNREVVAYPERFLKAKKGSSLLKQLQLIKSDQKRTPTSTEKHCVERIAGVSDPEVFIPLSPPRVTSAVAAVSPQRSIGTQTSIDDFVDEEAETNGHVMDMRPSVLSIWREREKKAKAALSTVAPM